MDVWVLELMEVIRHEVAAFERLLDLLAKEQRALVGHDVKAIEEAVDAQAEIARKAERLEAVRRDLVKKLAGALAERPDALTLKRLIERLQGPEADRLADLRDTLIGIQERIQKANRHNATLIRQSMKYVDRSLQILTGQGPSGVYGQKGKVDGSRGGVQTVLNRIV